jgi:hypothetical protein
MRKSGHQVNVHSLEARLQTTESEITAQKLRISELEHPTRHDHRQLNALNTEAIGFRNHIEIRRNLFTTPRFRKPKIDLE